MILTNSVFQNNWDSRVEASHMVTFYWLVLINVTLFSCDVNLQSDPNIHIH